MTRKIDNPKKGILYYIFKFLFGGALQAKIDEHENSPENIKRQKETQELFKRIDENKKRIQKLLDDDDDLKY